MGTLCHRRNIMSRDKEVASGSGVPDAVLVHEHLLTFSSCLSSDSVHPTMHCSFIVLL